MSHVSFVDCFAVVVLHLTHTVHVDSRYGPYTEWIASFDTDEYFVPMGDYSSLKDVLKDAAKGGTKILSLRSSRGRLRPDKSIDINGY